MPPMNTANDNDGTTWLSMAFSEIQRWPHLNDDLLEILLAFGKHKYDAPGPADLDPESMGITSDALQDKIAIELLDEIDADQASMFGRRFSSVSTLLREDDRTKNDNTGTTTNQLLRLALHRRTVQILSTSDPILSQRKAQRVRALVDFIWSTTLVLGLEETGGNVTQHPTLVDLVHRDELQSLSSAQYNQFSPGFYHATIEGITSDFGPVHINILRIDMCNSSCQMKCIDAREICTDLPTLAKQMGAVAAISGGFFLYSEPDIELPSVRTDPVGLLVSDGNIIGPPVFRRATIMQHRVGENDEGAIGLGLEKVGMMGVTCMFKLLSTNATSAQQFMDLTIGQDNLRCFHRGNAEEVVIEKDLCGFSVVGKTLVAVKSGLSESTMPVPLAGFVLVFPLPLLPNDMIMILDDMESIEVTYALPSPYSNVENAMTGGPIFFNCDSNFMDLPSEDFKGSAPPVTFSQDETHDHNLLPRMGVGIAKCSSTGNEELVCVAVDGRNLDRALGLTLQGTSNLLRSLGCTKAMNLDGGSSKRMVIWDPELKLHRVVCLSTTEIKANAGGENRISCHAPAEPSRPVHSAVLFLP